MCGFLCIMEALAISGYVTFADQDGKTQAICRDASAANLTICSDDYDGDGVYEAFAFVAD